MSSGYYKRRRGVVEHIESGVIDLLEDGIHDYLSLKANLVIGSPSSIPVGVCFTSAPAIHAHCKRVSERTIQRCLSHLEDIGWIKTFRAPNQRGNYPSLICRASVHDLAGNEYRINAAATTDWRHPVYEAVGQVSPETSNAVDKLAGNREVIGEKGKGKKKNPAAKTAPPADPRHQPFVDFAFAAFEQKHGQKPTWTGKDFKALSLMLAGNKGMGADELQRRFRNYLDSTEPFTRKQGDSLAYFCSHIDSFLAGPILAPVRKGTNGKPTGTDLAVQNARALGLTQVN